MAAESAPRDRMAHAIGTVQTAQRLGPALGPVIGGVVAQLVGLRRAFLVTSGFYVVALPSCSSCTTSATAASSRAAAGAPITFRNVLAFENFILLMAVIFGLQFVDRSFGPILPLYVAELGTPRERVPLVSGIIFSIAAGAGRRRQSAVRAAAAPRAAARSSRRGAPAASVRAVPGGAATAWLFARRRSSAWRWAPPRRPPTRPRARSCPPNARGAGFGLLTTASLTGWR